LPALPTPHSERRRCKLAKRTKTTEVEVGESTPKGGKEVELSSLDTLQAFDYKGVTYRKRRVHGGGITCLSIEGNKLLTLDPDTLVTPQ
jgi:hypothetical protein